MSFHEMIDTQDIKAIRTQINSDNVHTRNAQGETLLVYMIKHYNNAWHFTLSSLILQHLLNMGADKTPLMEYATTCVQTQGFDPSTKKFFEHFLRSQKAKGLQTTTRRPTSQSRSSAQGHKKSLYSAQEKLQLDRIAMRLGIPLQDNHLALKIISHLMRDNICIGCQEQSVICRECLNRQQ